MKSEYSLNEIKISPKEAARRIKRNLAFIPSCWKNQKKTEKNGVSPDQRGGTP